MIFHLHACFYIPDEPQDQPADREPASVGQTRTRRRRWAPVVAVLLVATIGVLGAWISRPRAREASPRSTEASPRSGEASVSSLRMLVADFRPLGVTAPEPFQTVTRKSLSKSGSFDDSEKRWLRDAGLRRALVVKFTHSKAGRRLELRIFEVRGPDEARTLQEKLSICSTIAGTKRFRAAGVTGSAGRECAPQQVPTQEVTFTRGPRLFKVKLWGRAAPRSRDLIVKLARAEAAVAR